MTSKSTAIYLYHNNPLCLCITLQFYSLSIFTHTPFFFLLNNSFIEIQFTCHKIHSQVCNHHHCLVPDIFITHQKNLIPLSSRSPFPSPHSLRQPLIYFLSPQICLFRTRHINGVIQCLFFCVWFISPSVFSGFTCVVAFTKLVFLFMVNNAVFHGVYVPSFYLSPPDGHAGCFHILVIGE